MSSTVAVITSTVDRHQFDELLNRFGDHVRREGDTVVVPLNLIANERAEKEFRGIAKCHGYEFTL